MDGLILRSLLLSTAVLLLYSVLRAVYTIWWGPKSLEKRLTQQGIRGTSYKLFYGDKKDFLRLNKEALSKPISLNHQIASRVLPFTHHMVQTYDIYLATGKFCVEWVGTRARLIIADPELIRLALTEKDGHIQKQKQNPLVNILSLGLSALEGEKWAKHRTLMTPAFHHGKLKGMGPAFSASCCNMIDRWNELVSPEGSCELDVALELQNLTGDVIARTAFGSSYEAGKKIFEFQKEQATLVMEAFEAFYFPGLRFIPTKKNRRRYYLDNEIKTTIRGIIREKEQAKKNTESSSTDLLGLLLQCKEQKDNEMTIEDVIEECKLFYFAGQETTANLLTWTIIALSMHPNWQEKAREEVLQIWGHKTPDVEGINHLKIVSAIPFMLRTKVLETTLTLEPTSFWKLVVAYGGNLQVPMVVHEVLRLYPPVVFMLRQIHQRTNIGGLSIPEGIDLYLPVLLLHHDPDYWGGDVEEFKPERFAEGVSKASKDQMAFYPFGWGPRVCIGQNFAMMEAKMALAMILQHFWFELSPTYTHAPFTVITLQPQHGAPIILHQI
ncbi:cytochrome P450 CYP72A616-like isoform X1 [Malania oleifera]|uniref:cytochrome P450 CYP72A616-like isoform X1 n=1 Tax=Malania oleifera TaxID=397392 RepID=UPI0025AE4CDB|nr:cytochrome P450 CYP72A616-like isoform X1 [Malania oleifera]